MRLSDVIGQYCDESGKVDRKYISEILRGFSCSQNEDINEFLHHKSIEFDIQSIARTYLVMVPYKGKQVIVGYFALAIKAFLVKYDSRISQTLKRRVTKFGQYEQDLKQWVISAPLIGQLAKNDKYLDLIDGAVLLELACREVAKVHMIAGGKIVYLECENKPKLINFYENNGFVNFGSRKLEDDEKTKLCGTELIQMLKYLK